MTSWQNFFFRGCLILPVILASYSSQAQSELMKIWRNNGAVEKQGQEKKQEAFDEFAKLLVEDPFHPIFQFNMGGAFLQDENTEKAKKMWGELLKKGNLPPELAFATHFNMGVLEGADGQFDRALASYQAALEFQPDSVEVKTNIEMLIQQQKKGGGKGGGKDKKKGKGDKDKKDDKGEDDNKDFQNKDPNYKPEFKGEKMSKKDVEQILGELKKQEQKIRAKHNRKEKKQRANNGKNW